MPSLVDVAPPEFSAEEVDIRGTKLSVRGVMAEEWATLHAKYPALRELLAGSRKPADANIDDLRGQAALIAAGLGKINDDDTAYLVMAKLNADDQRVMVETIIRLSMPAHVFGPLLNGAAAAHHIVAPGGRVQATRSPRQPRR